MSAQTERPPIIARLTTLDRFGNYLIDVTGVPIRSRYPENRMAKVLLIAGVTGKLEVYGPDRFGNDILRITIDIEKHGRRQMSETEDGIRWLPWTENSLAPLRIAAKKVKRSLAERRKHGWRTKAPAKPEIGSSVGRFTRDTRLRSRN